MDLERASLGQLLRHYRRAADLKQEELAERAGLSPRGLSAIEHDQRRPRTATLALLMDALTLADEERARVEAARKRSRTTTAPPVTTSPVPPLVGRERELQLLERHLAGVGTPATPVLVFAGEPGIGKSRLLDEAASRAAGHGLRVLRGGARRGGGTPYAPLLDALKQYIDGQPPARLRAELAGCAWLTRLLPELASLPAVGPALLEALPAWPVPPEQERRLMFDAVARFLANVAGVRHGSREAGGGTLLVLDDLQWAGADALDLLLALLRSPAPAPVGGSPAPAHRERGVGGAGSLRVVAAYRDTEAPPDSPLAIALADLAEAGFVTRHALAPLSPMDTEQLLDAVVEDARGLDAAIRAQVVRRAGGVPFFLMSLAQALRQDTPDANETDGRDPIPWNLAQSLLRRVAALPDSARTLLGAAAVVGRAVPAALLVAVLARPEDEVLDDLEAAVAARLLGEEESAAYRFAHDVIRETVEADLGAGRRATLHRRVAAALEAGAGEPPVEELAYHYSRAGDAAAEKAILYLERAGDRAAAQAAYAAAEGYYGELAARLDRLGRPLDAARAREQRGTALRLAVRFEAALAAFDEAAEAYRAADDLDALGRVIAWIGHTHAERGTTQKGVARIMALLLSLEEGGARRGLAALYARLAFLLFVSGRYDWQLAAATRAAAMGEEIGDNSILSHAEGARGLALLMLGNLDEAFTVLVEAAPVTEAAGELEALASTLTNVATVDMWRGRFDEARPYAERAIAVAERISNPAHIVLVTLRRAFLDMFEGNWSRARETVEWTSSLEPSLLDSWSVVYPLLTRGVLLFLEGDWKGAATDLERSVALAGPSGDIAAIRWAQTWLAERDLRAGCPAEARDRLVPLLDRPEMREAGWHELDVTALLPRLAWAHLELGDVEQAAAMAEESVERARAQEHRIALADALWVRAMVASRQEDWEEARQALEEGLAVARAMPYPYAEARILETYGLTRRAQGAIGPAERPYPHAIWSPPAILPGRRSAHGAVPARAGPAPPVRRDDRDRACRRVLPVRRL